VVEGEKESVDRQSLLRWAMETEWHHRNKADAVAKMRETGRVHTAPAKGGREQRREEKRREERKESG
jgi:hypothetical protein